MLKTETVRAEVKPTTIQETDADGNSVVADSFAYRIRILGAQMAAYRDVYNVSVTLDNGMVLKKTFQFCNSKGELEAKYLSIKNAYEWNLYFGDSGNIVDAAKAAAEKTVQTAEEKLLAEYAGWTYHQYANASYNVEIEGIVDFSLLKNINNGKETPVMNVLANNVRGKAGDNGIGKIQNLNLTTNSDTRGLFKNIGGGICDLTFENNAIRWKTSQAYDTSGLLGQVAGGMQNCTFINTILTGGKNNFGIMATCDGDIENVTATNTYVVAVGDYVGGLAGVLRGDIVKVNVSGNDEYPENYTGERGYQVTGNSYTGGIAGRTYGVVHEKNGHEWIGGADNTTELQEGETRKNWNENGWYNSLMAQDKDYRADVAGSTDERYVYDSLSYNYARISQVTLNNISVNGYKAYAGGITAEVNHVKKTAVMVIS